MVGSHTRREAQLAPLARIHVRYQEAKIELAKLRARTTWRADLLPSPKRGELFGALQEVKGVSVVLRYEDRDECRAFADLLVEAFKVADWPIEGGKPIAIPSDKLGMRYADDGVTVDTTGGLASGGGWDDSAMQRAADVLIEQLTKVGIDAKKARSTWPIEGLGRTTMGVTISRVP